MPDNPEMIEEQETDLESPPTDLQEGYQILLTVTRDGFSVSEPTPLPPAPQSPDTATSDEDMVPDLTSAIKHLLAVVKAHPVGEDEQAQFAAGYESR